MNIQSSWLNLPVKDLKASATFFENIGFTIKKNEAVLDKMRGIETAGGKVLQRGTKHEGFYGGLFSDIDGHLFNIIAM